MRYLLPAILLLGTQIASAQSILKDKDDKELSVLLNEVVITGTGTEHYLKDAPVQTEVITSKALEQYQARSIDDLLEPYAEKLECHTVLDYRTYKEEQYDKLAEHVRSHLNMPLLYQIMSGND